MNTSNLYHSLQRGARRGLSLLMVLAFSVTSQAQDTYTNERITNSSNDVIGTARYVGMGGALGALGADMSVISWNPAGIGLYRKNDIALTFGGTWGKSSISEESRGKGTFDQAGIVFSLKTESKSCPYVNFAFNYQKKINFNQNFYANNGNLGGLSQMDQLAQLIEWDDDWQNNLTGLALEYDQNREKKGEDRIFFQKDASGNLYNDRPSESYDYKYHGEGSLRSFDINVSTNINDRAFLGLTIGIDNLRYQGWSYYRENFDAEGRLPNYDLTNDYDISGTGVNLKFGTIIRPFASSPFRFAFAVETPTWFKLTNSTLFDYSNNVDNGPESLLDFSLRTPWKIRTGIGSTIGSVFAWDIDYEYAAFAGTSMGFRNNGDFNISTANTSKDVAMNQNTRDNMRGTHTLRVGMEINATKNLAFRLGYNLSTSPFKKNISYNQYEIDKADIERHRLPRTAIDYATSTSYMRMGATNTITLGMGYHTKRFYIDLAYKIRNQKADFYAFDTGFANSETGDPVFLDIAPADLADATINPVDVNLTRHAITCTLGFKF